MKNTRCALHFPVAAFALASAFAAIPVSIFAQTWTGATNAGWGTATNWSATPTFNSSADILFDNTGTVTNRFTTIGLDRIVRSITFGAGVDDPVLIGYREFATSGLSRSLTLQAASGNASITVNSGATGAITMGANTTVALAGGNLILGSNLDISHNGSGTLLFNRPTTGGGFAITKTGTGTWQVDNNINSPGAINIDGGTFIGNTFGTGDINTATSLNLRGGTFEIRSGGGVGADKGYNTVPVNVTSASTLVYNNTATATRNASFTGTAGFVVNAPLSIKNMSTATVETFVNGLNIGRAITGTGKITVETYNNISSSANSYTLGRVLFSGNNTGWSGDLEIASGTISLSSASGPTPVNAAGGGSILLGTTGDTFGAGITFFYDTAIVPTTTTVTYNNNLTVRSGGFRSIKGGNSDHNIAFTGNVTLEGSLNVDHTLSSVRNISFDGDISGPGGISVTRVGGSATTGVLFNGVNTYLGTTTVANGAAIGGDGSIAGAITFQAGSSFIFNPAAPLTVGSVVEFDGFGISNLIGLTVDTPDATYSILSGAIGADIRTAGLLNFGAGSSFELAPGKEAYFELTSGNLNLVVGAPIPEPSAFAALAGLAALGLIATRRRRRIV